MTVTLMRGKETVSYHCYTTFLILTVVVSIFGGCFKHEAHPVIRGAYFDQEPPGDTAKLFAPGILSTGMHDDCGPAFNSDNSEVYFRIAQAPHSIIAFMVREDDVWSEPEIVSFSGLYSDGRPALTADAKRIYFSSYRTIEGVGESKADEDIWFVERFNRGWGEPVRLDTIVNSPSSDWGVSVASNGTIYYTHTTKIDNASQFRIFRSSILDGQHLAPEDLGERINRFGAASPCIASDESFIVFTSMNRPENTGASDLYVSFRLPDDTWSEPASLGDDVNSAGFDYFPSLSPDGKYLFFVSDRSREWSHSENRRTFEEMKQLYTGPQNGRNDIYWVDVNVIRKLMPRPN